jgi:hypothetical protein
MLRDKKGKEKIKNNTIYPFPQEDILIKGLWSLKVFADSLEYSADISTSSPTNIVWSPNSSCFTRLSSSNGGITTTVFTYMQILFLS